MPFRAHPRVCGENENVAGHDDAFQGSSPRVRGKQRVSCCVPSSCGLIPARAGKTPHGVGVGVERRAHPRACGENSARRWASRLARGSSPRVRGKLRPALGLQAGARLIPACAGKTHSRGGTWRARRAHPRVCGENLETGFLEGSHEGSSPRVRGKLRQDFFEEGRRRLIPACAGKTTSPTPCGSTGRAHPRVCGENGSGTRRCALRPGSSPRVRGKQHPRQPGRHLEGLIPACAGKTVRRSQCRGPHGAHPRACGENLRVRVPSGALLGSSPRVRGKPVSGVIEQS